MRVARLSMSIACMHPYRMGASHIFRMARVCVCVWMHKEGNVYMAGAWTAVLARARGAAYWRVRLESVQSLWTAASAEHVTNDSRNSGGSTSNKMTLYNNTLLLCT